MSDWFYNLVRGVGYPAFGTSSSPVVLHAQRLRRPGAFILAPNHLSPYDIPCLMATAPRVLDFVSVTELFQNRLVAWLFTNMGAFPLDRWQPDAPTVRTILGRLARGRAVVMFPEGGIRNPRSSLLAGGAFRPGVMRIAQLAGVPIVPCVILGTSAYRRFDSWLPLRQTVYAVNFGQAIHPDSGDDAEMRMERRLRAAYLSLFNELRQALDARGKRLTVDEFPRAGGLTTG